jgi:hypothetical protein
VEFALALPLLLVVIAGIVDFGFLFQRYEVLTNAAREGARIASLPGYVTCGANPGDPASSFAGVDSRVRSYVQQGLSLSTSQMAVVMPADSVDVSCEQMSVSNPGGGTIDVDTVRVGASYNHTFLLLGPVLGLIDKTLGNARTLTARSEMRLEAQTVVPGP